MHILDATRPNNPLGTPYAFLASPLSSLRIGYYTESKNKRNQYCHKKLIGGDKNVSDWKVR